MLSMTLLLSFNLLLQLKLLHFMKEWNSLVEIMLMILLLLGSLETMEPMEASLLIE